MLIKHTYVNIKEVPHDRRAEKKKKKKRDLAILDGRLFVFGNLGNLWKSVPLTVIESEFDSLFLVQYIVWSKILENKPG